MTLTLHSVLKVGFDFKMKNKIKIDFIDVSLNPV